MIEIEYYKLLDQLKTNKYSSFRDKWGWLYYTNGEKFYIQFTDSSTKEYTEQEFLDFAPEDIKNEVFKMKFENEVNK